jgi:DNA-binding NarL/FixJ family response regulator
VGSLISQEKDLVCCGQAATATEALALAREVRPDLAVVDLRLKVGDGLELIKTLKAEMPELRVLVLSQHAEQVFVERALRAGAMGYVVKEQATEEIMTAIRSVLAGEMFVTKGIAARLTQGSTPRENTSVGDPASLLTDREIEVFRRLGEGKTTREIAVELQVSYKTVESHRENIKHKLKLQSAAEILSAATRWISR